MSTTDIEIQNVIKNREKEGPQISKMKKYTKLVLVVIALISSFCFLFYKYRYDRLYNVLQVLEVFGTPDDSIRNPDCGVKNSSNQLPSLTPAWQRVDDDLYLFSAYCEVSPENSEGCPLVTIVSIGSGHLADYKCKMWFEGSIKALEGILTMSKDSQDDNTEVKFAPYTLKCESKFTSKVPYALTVYKNEDIEGHIPVQPTYKVTDKPLLNLCILPTSSPIDLTSPLRESLIFHTYIGISNIIIYTTGVSTSVLRTITQLQSNMNMNISLVHWNSPKLLSSGDIVSLVTQDCYHQTRDKYKSYLVLTNNQILMPRTDMSLSATVSHVSLSRGPNRLSVRKFCSEYPPDKQSQNFLHSLSLLQSTFYNKQLSDEVTNNLNYLGEVTRDASNNIDNVFTINEYGPCDRYDFKETDKTANYDSSALRFSKGLLNFYSNNS